MVHRFTCLLVVAACGRDGASGAADAELTAPAAEVAVERVDQTRWLIDDSTVSRVAAELALGTLVVEQTSGVRHAIRGVPSDAWFAALDLVAGDEIESIAGVAPGRPRLRAIADAIHQQREARVVLHRGGVMHTRRYVLASKILIRPHLTLPRPVAATPEEERLGAAMRTGVRPVAPDHLEIDTLVVHGLRPDLLGQGYEFTRGRGAAIKGNPVTAALGLTGHDTVKQVGTTDVSTTGDVVAAMRAAGPEFSLVVERLGEPVILRYTAVVGRVDEAAHRDAVAAWDAAQASLAATVAEFATAGSPDDPAAAALVATIGRLDETTYQVSRKALTQLLANPIGLAKGARVVPSVKNGAPNGFKLYAIRPRSLFASLGIVNGDTIHAIDRRELASMESLLDLSPYLATAISTAKEIELSVTRRGKPVTLTYRLVD